jgi:hypothetical protein
MFAVTSECNLSPGRLLHRWLLQPACLVLVLLWQEVTAALLLTPVGAAIR